MKIWKAWDWLLDTLAAVAAAVTAAMCVGICADVALRNLDYDGIPWVFDLTEYGLLVVTGCMAAYLSRFKRHVEVDIVLMLVRPETARIMRLISVVLTLLICFGLFWYALRATWQSYEGGSLIFRYVMIPEWMPFAVIAIMFLSLGIEALRQVHDVLRHPAEAITTPSDKAF